MNHGRRTCRSTVGLMALLTACGGSGSDVGPRLERLPDASGKILVLDDANRGVCGARVTVAGATAVTGRSGRADLLADPRGRLVVQVTGDAAAAVAGDDLATLAFVDDLPGGQLPRAAHLPDLSASSGLALAGGTQVAGVALDDSGSSGARIEIGAGTVIGASGAFTLRSGSLTVEHLPGILPTASTGAFVFGRGVFVGPASVTFGPAATLELPDDLGSPVAADVRLFWLDPEAASPVWTEVTGTVTVAGGRLRMANAIQKGGLYAFATAVATTVTVRGRLLDATNGALACSLVHIGEARTQTDDNGRFELTLAATRADGAARTVQFERHGGRCHRPITGTSAVVLPITGGVHDVGDVVLDTLLVGNLRVQTVVGGRADAGRRLSLSSLDGNVALTTTGDDQGRSLFEDVPQGWFGFTEGRPIDARRVLLGQAIGFQQFGRRWTDVNQFALETFWFLGARNSRTQVIDARGGGPVRGAAVVRGSAPDGGFVQFTREGGLVIANRAFDGQATVAVRTTGDGRTVTSAFTIVEPNGEHLEMPVQRAELVAPGAFDRHGVLAGSLLDVTLPATLRVRTTRRLEPSDWFDAVFLGVPIASSLPIDVDPAVTGTAPFRLGVASPRGQVATVQGQVVGGDFTLQRVGFVRDLVVPEATVVERSIRLDRPVDTTFTVPGAALGLDAAFGGGDLGFDLALQFADGAALDVARAIGGNHAVAGDDVQLQLPALDGELAGAQWLVALGAEATVGGATVTQRTLHRLRADHTAANVPFLAVPVLAEPLANATVPATGFTVRWTAPVDADYLTLDLRFADSTDTAAWQVVIPPDRTEFAFVRLPTQAATPLAAGRGYTLTLTAWRMDAGPFPEDPQRYRNLTTFWRSTDAIERGVTAMASRSIPITTN